MPKERNLAKQLAIGEPLGIRAQRLSRGLTVSGVAGVKFLTVAVRRESTHSLTEFTLRPPRGPIGFLSDATKDVILASWRRIQFTDTGNASNPHRCKISPGADCPGKSHDMTLPHVRLSVFAPCPSSNTLTQ